MLGYSPHFCQSKDAEMGIDSTLAQGEEGEYHLQMTVTLC